MIRNSWWCNMMNLEARCKCIQQRKQRKVVVLFTYRIVEPPIACLSTPNHEKKKRMVWAFELSHTFHQRWKVKYVRLTKKDLLYDPKPNVKMWSNVMHVPLCTICSTFIIIHQEKVSFFFAKVFVLHNTKLLWEKKKKIGRKSMKSLTMHQPKNFEVRRWIL